MVLIGGQLKIDTNLIPPLASMISPFNRLLSIVKLAALAFLEIESSLYDEEGNKNDHVMKSLELDFSLAQKSYTVAINGISAVAMNRPGCLKFAAITLARRTMDPPTAGAPTTAQRSDEVAIGNLTRAGVIAVTSQLMASCLTLLRNPLSANVKDVHEWLHRALVYSDMTIQADKAFAMAKQQAALRTAGRAARNRAALFYEWDQSEADKQSKRQRETDDALAKLRAAKVARGLGNGIQLPTNMVDACELVLLNIKHTRQSTWSI
jgi:symplekin